MTHLACINGFNLTSFDCAIIVMENGGFTFYWLAGMDDRTSTEKTVPELLVRFWNGFSAPVPTWYELGTVFQFQYQLGTKSVRFSSSSTNLERFSVPVLFFGTGTVGTVFF